MGLSDTLFGKPPSTSVAFAPGFKAPGYNFAQSLSNYLTGLIGQPGPEYHGSLDPGLSPTLANLGQMMQGYATSPAPYIMGQAAGTLGRFMNPSFGNPATELASPGPSFFGGAAPGGRPGVMPGGSPLPGGPGSPVPGAPPPQGGSPFSGPLAAILASLGAAAPGQGPALNGGVLNFGPPLQPPGPQPTITDFPRPTPLPTPIPKPGGSRRPPARKPGETSGASAPPRQGKPAKPQPGQGSGPFVPAGESTPPIFRKPFGGGGSGGGRG